MPTALQISKTPMRRMSRGLRGHRDDIMAGRIPESQSSEAAGGFIRLRSGRPEAASQDMLVLALSGRNKFRRVRRMLRGFTQGATSHEMQCLPQLALGALQPATFSTWMPITAPCRATHCFLGPTGLVVC
ncbi:hypothetical protein AXF42_Ash011522 [Apostasia shenzhenica]|uniref:Uncharacterized protein n=1 Tax=Apostasia shenzhenica TaxID=1088818 RepID=A0A2I0BAV5_9ASPA|nr:hypothetical protein AXF42_Ash011522 [Apostasia shenzhenica]